MCVKFTRSSRLTFLLLSIFIAVLPCDAAEGEKYRTSVAVIDMAKVLREHPRLQHALASLNKEMDEHGDLMQPQKAEFAKRKAKLYRQAHNEIRVRVEEFAQRHKIDLVLNFDSSDVEGDDPERIMNRLTDQVVYQARLNITEHVIAILQRR